MSQKHPGRICIINNKPFNHLGSKKVGLASNLIDGRLVGRALAQDPVAFEELVRRHMPAVSAVAMAYTKNHTDAEDVVQESFLKAWQSLDSLRTPRRFGGWVVTIARNAARNLHNKKRRELEKLDHVESKLESEIALKDVTARDQLRELLPTLVSELSEPDREIILLHYQGEKKTREIADLMDLSHDAVRKRMQRIRAKLGQALLASLKPGDAEREQRNRRSTKIASALIAVPPTWKSATASAATTSAAGLSLAAKGIAVGFVLAVVIGFVYFEYGVENIPAPDTGTNTPAVVATSQGETEQNSIQNPSVEPSGLILENDPPLVSETGLSSISGRLYEEDTGKGVEGMLIQALHVDSAVRTDVKTNHQGRYRFENLPPGQIRLYWGMDDRFRERYPRNANGLMRRKLELKSDVALENIDFTVIRGLTVSGTVYSPDRIPLAGAKIAGRTEPNAIDYTTTADDEGRFTFNGFGTDLPAFFWPRHPGFAMPPLGPVKIPAEGIENLELTMGPESTIAGRLVDQHGSPLEGVRVTPWPKGVYSLPNNYSGTTNEKGEFLVAGLHESSYRMSITLPGEIRSHRLFNVDELEVKKQEQLNGIELIYAKPGDMTISGRVTDELGKPRRDVEVTAQRGNHHQTGRTDKQGYYGLDGIGSGIYEVRVANLVGYIEAEGGGRHVDFTLPRLGTIRGRVIDAGTLEPIPSFEIMRPLDPLNWYEYHSADGRFELKSQRANTFEIRARAPGYAAGSSVTYTLLPGGVLEETIVKLERAGTIVGHVVAPDGNPVRDATVGNPYFSFLKQPRTNAKGDFVFAEAKAGTYSITVWHPDYAPAEKEVTVVSEETTEVEIQLSKGAHLQGRLTRRDVPVEDVRIELFQRTGENAIGYSKETNTDGDGNYEFPGIPEGELILHLNPMSKNQGRVIVVPLHFSSTEEETLNIELHAGDASTVFFVEMDEELRLRKGRIYVGIEYFFENGETEKYYSYNLENSEHRIHGLRTGTATLTARYTSANSSRRLAALEPREITIQEGIENHFILDFTNPIE
jgi:RNA polymerase sigma-70 factor (ECF subfamily)